MGTATMCPLPGGMSRLQPGQRYDFVAWYGWMKRVSTASSAHGSGWVTD